MLLSLITSGMSFREILIQLLLLVPVLLFSFSIHECAHAYVADKMGDHTAKNFGRLTLNPLKHLDPIGTLGMLLVGVGWAKPVPINARYFKNPKKGMALSALAGPLSNLIVAFLAVILQQLLIRLLPLIPYSETAQSVVNVVYTLFYITSWMNLSLCVFNLIPIPPFDGSRIAFAILPDRIYWGMMKYERYIMIGFLVLIYGLGRIGISPVAGITEALLNLLYKLTNWIQLI